MTGTGEGSREGKSKKVPKCPLTNEVCLLESSCSLGSAVFNRVGWFGFHGGLKYSRLSMDTASSSSLLCGSKGSSSRHHKVSLVGLVWGPS